MRVSNTTNFWSRIQRSSLGRLWNDQQFQDYLAGKTWPEQGEGDLIHEHLRDPWKASHMLLFRHWIGKPINPDTAKVSQPPVVVPGLQIKPADQVRKWTLANAGARPADRDPVDTRVIQQVCARKGGIIKSQDDVGGWPDLAEKRRDRLNAVLCEWAERYLTESGHSVEAIAAILGYGDVSNFRRAFRSWTGLSPGDFRRREQAV